MRTTEMYGVIRRASRNIRAMRLRSRAGKLDQAIFDSVAGWSPSALDRVLPRLSRVADHSLLWFALAAGLAATRRATLRRAALRGVTGIGIASPLVNLLGKQLFRRVRPRIDLVPPVRVRWRVPTSPAFPSGHSASAAAFAVGVALEAPRRVSVPIALLAGAVACSRVYTGAHYPGDVLAGLAIGASAGAATRMLWPTHPATVRTLTGPPIAPPDDGAGVVAVVNRGAGRPGVATPSAVPSGAAGGGPNPIADALREALPAAEIIEVDAGDAMDGAIDAAARRARVLAVAGGDGTLTTAAAAALRYGVPLLPVPAGTFDHFARALGMETVGDALAAYHGGRIAAVDVGRVTEPDGRVRLFLNAATFGAYPELVDRRERLERRLGKWPALAVAAVRVLRHVDPLRVLVNGRPRWVWIGFVGNCRYSSYGPAPIWRRGLDDGRLDIRLITTRRRRSRSRAVAALLAGHLRLVPGYRAWRGRTLTLDRAPATMARVPARGRRPLRGRRPGGARTSRRAPAGPGAGLRLGVDGETHAATTPLVFGKERAALAVFRPA